MSDYTDPRWQRKRLEIFERDGFKCSECGAADRPLHVHHLYYCKGRTPWEYPNFALQTRCEDCHDVHAQTVRDDYGVFCLTDWEQVVEWITNGDPATFGKRGGLWDYLVTEMQQR